MKTLKSLPLFAILLLSGPGLAQTDTAPDEDPRQALFRERREIEHISHHERIRILQQADACIAQAENWRAYRQCEQQEQAARKALRQRLGPRLQALRERVRALRAEHRARSRQPAG